MLFGYCEQQVVFVYCMFNIKTEKIVISCDIIWLNKTWGNWKIIKDIDIEDKWVQVKENLTLI